MVLISILSTLAVLTISSILFMNLAPQFGAKSRVEALERIEKSPNYKDGKFQNLKNTAVMLKTDWANIQDYFKKRGKTPDWSIPVEKINPERFSENQGSNVGITWFGHSTVLLEFSDKVILFDPVFANSPSPIWFIGPKRFNKTRPLEIEQLPDIDAVLISHDHYDHLDYGSILKLKDKVKVFYVPLGVGAHLKRWGVNKEQIVELDWWDEVSSENLTFAATPARHFSGRGLFNQNTTLWCSWVIKSDYANIFFSGDSGYDSTISEKIGEKYGPFDFTMMECGQYNVQWGQIHSMPEETVQAHIDLKGKLLMPIHWGAFKLALHDWEEPVERLLKKADALHVKVTTPIIGEQVILNNNIPNSKWWRRNL